MTVCYHVINATCRVSFFLLSSFFPKNFLHSFPKIFFSFFFVSPPPLLGKSFSSSFYFLPSSYICIFSSSYTFMEEVPVHVHQGPIVPDILTRQHEHRSGLIWSGDHETCFTDLQYRRFGRNLFQCYNTAPCRLLRGDDHTYWSTQHASHVEVWHQWRLRVRDSPAFAVEVLSYPYDEYIRWYQGITRVYIGNPANRDTRSIGYQPAGVEKRMMVHSRVFFFFFCILMHFIYL
ncbi:hypothetical protein M9H77_13115 [Catharanthus roseus]|uniref:Uncharacterized protein n=1 Tax=Catharanthus roseus TaxID=4058 RepID=A0ACC0BJA5_CATRO|nr:hypothetical protein M9H77_13115 [Catharanthus roseus]